MKTLLLITIVAISSASAYNRRHHHHFDSDEDDHLIHPPLWNPQSGRDAPGPGRDFGSFHPFGPGCRDDESSGDAPGPGRKSGHFHPFGSGGRDDGSSGDAPGPGRNIGPFHPFGSGGRDDGSSGDTPGPGRNIGPFHPFGFGGRDDGSSGDESGPGRNIGPFHPFGSGGRNDGASGDASGPGRNIGPFHPFGPSGRDEGSSGDASGPGSNIGPFHPFGQGGRDVTSSREAPGPGLNNDPIDPLGPDGSENGSRHIIDGLWNRLTTTKPPRVTYPIYPTTTSKTIDSGSTSARPIGLGLTDLESCKNACPVTTEHNPVCGTDNVSYGNIGLLECARSCGVDVKLKRNSQCSTQTPSPTTEKNIDNVEACLRNCPVTSEYNPVCGSNNITYANPGRMECARNCGVVVYARRPVACAAPPSLAEATAACMTTCSVTSEYNPVCGTDNVTYPNAGRLECARNCGRDVEISRRSSCVVPPGPNNPDLRGSTEKPNANGNRNCSGSSFDGDGCDSGSGNGSGSGSPSMTEIIACMQLCPITLEVNAVCGTDGVTYSNPGKLLCAQFCGVDVRVRKFAPCLGVGKPISNENTLFCPTLPTPTDLFTNPPTIQDCTNKCTILREHKPVCGTDGVTYMNIESLLCKIKCGADVSIHKLSPCGSSTDQPTAQTPPVWDRSTEPTVVTTSTPAPTTSVAIQICLRKCMTSQEYKPVCGTDGKTYANLPALQCAKRCGIKVEVKSLSPCFKPSVDGNKDGNTTDNGLGFTIPADVLEAVFNVTQPPTPDSDESYELDIKFGEANNSTGGK